MIAVVALVLADCVVPADQTAGWKVTPLPQSAPALAAPSDVEQFRSSEPALVLSEPLFRHFADASLGTLTLRFLVPPEARHFRVRFTGRLDGMKVDADVVEGGAALPVLAERRIASDEVRLDWQIPEVREVRLKLHYHLRSRPVVETWRHGAERVVSEDARAPALFHVSRSLVWKHPGEGRQIELCDSPGVRLELTEWKEGFATASGADPTAVPSGRRDEQRSPTPARRAERE